MGIPTRSELMTVPTETAILRAQQGQGGVGPALSEGARKSIGKTRTRRAAGRPGKKGENISPLRLTELPPDFDFIASKSADEKTDYIRAALARSESEAINIIAPALQYYGTAASVVEAYLPLIIEVKKHFCRPGRPRINPATGERSQTWEEICTEHLHIGLRRTQQILASLRQPKLLGEVSPTRRKRPIDRHEFERARRIAAPGCSLAAAVIKDGLARRFPEALEILNLADIPVPVVQPIAVIADASQDWKGILTSLVATLEQYGDTLPLPVIAALKSTQELLDGKAKPQAAAKEENSERAKRPGGKGGAGLGTSAHAEKRNRQGQPRALIPARAQLEPSRTALQHSCQPSLRLHRRTPRLKTRLRSSSQCNRRPPRRTSRPSHVTGRRTAAP
jgi:hypothetical protein